MPVVIAEVGCNHKGSLPIALEMIQEASKCGADIVKFQKRNNRECLRPEVYSGPHPNPINSYGKTNDFQHLDSTQVERVNIPEDTDVIKTRSKESMKTLERPEDDTQTLFSEPPEDIKLSSDFDNLPLLTNKDGLLKVFQPPVGKTNDLTPNIDATFRLPSDFIFKKRTSREISLPK